MGLFDTRKVFDTVLLNGVTVRKLNLDYKKKYYELANKCDVKNTMWESGFAFLYINSLTSDVFICERDGIIITYKNDDKKSYNILSVLAVSLDVFNKNIHSMMDEIMTVTNGNVWFNQMPVIYSEGIVDAYNSISDKGVLKPSDDYGDFIFLNQSLIDLKGSKFKARRNMVNKFKKENPIHSIREYSDSDIDAVERIRNYFIENRMANEHNIWDLNFYDKFIEFRDSLDIDIFVVEVNGTVEGYIMFAPLCKNTNFTIIENTISSFKGINEYLWYEGLRMLNEKHGGKFIYSNDGNGGVEDGGLYKYKESHYPIYRIEKKYVDFKKNAKR